MQCFDILPALFQNITENEQIVAFIIVVALTQKLRKLIIMCVNIAYAYYPALFGQAYFNDVHHIIIILSPKLKKRYFSFIASL